MDIKEKKVEKSFKILICFAFLNSFSLEAVVKDYFSQTWLRFKEPIENIKVSAQGHYIAFFDSDSGYLKILDVKSKEVKIVSNEPGLGSSFFWSPYGFRLFFRETHFDSKRKKFFTKIWGYDCALAKKILVTQQNNETGFLTFNPIENSAYFLSKQGISSIKLSYPGVRLEKWKQVSRSSHGRFIVGQNGVLWSSFNGLKIKQLSNDDSKVKSYSISSDGKYIAWASENGNLFLAADGEDATLIDKGIDPQWHSRKNILLYAGARVLGSVASNYDIKSWVAGEGKIWLTDTPQLNERSPAWFADSDKILYLKENTTDIFLLNSKNFKKK